MRPAFSSATSRRRSACEMKPLGDTFIRLIKMLITLVIFCTVSVGIARMESLKQVGRVGFKTIALLRSGDDDRARDRPGRRERAASGRGSQHRSRRRSMRSAVSHFVSEVHSASHELPRADRAEFGGRRVRARRSAAGAAVLGAVRHRAVDHVAAQPVPHARHRTVRRHADAHRRDDHAARAARRIRRDRLHGRQVRHRHLAATRSADSVLLHDEHPVHRARARHGLPLGGRRTLAAAYAICARNC